MAPVEGQGFSPAKKRSARRAVPLRCLTRSKQSRFDLRLQPCSTAARHEKIIGALCDLKVDQNP